VCNDKSPSSGQQGGTAIDNHSPRKGRCGSGRICLCWLSYPLNNSPDISCRNTISCAAMQNLDSQIWKSRISISTKLKLYNTCILPIFLYGSECGQLPGGMYTRLMLSINGVCVSCLESNGTTMCGMMMRDGKQSSHIFWLLFKHGVSSCSATLTLC